MRFSRQPDHVRFFEEIATSLETGPWRQFEVGVAWARENAVASLTPVLRQFLEARGAFRITVGIGLQGTSREALELLLDLETAGDSESFVYHNEAPEETFHPKVFLFTAQQRARLIVGSSNLTDGGLATNIEAAIDLESGINGAAVVQAAEFLIGLRDTDDSRIKRLTRAFLAELTAAGYVLAEAELRTRRAAQTTARVPNRRARPRLFGTVHRARLPRAPRVQAQIVAATVLLIRPRRASETVRRTPVQIPIRLTRTAFFCRCDINRERTRQQNAHPRESDSSRRSQHG